MVRGRAVCKCGWASEPAGDAAGEFLAVVHVACRHPDWYAELTGETLAVLLDGFNRSERAAYDIALEAGLI
jgi:hypothetical protein